MTVRCHYILTPQEASMGRVWYTERDSRCYSSTASSMFCKSIFFVAFCSSEFRSSVEWVQTGSKCNPVPAAGWKPDSFWGGRCCWSNAPTPKWPCGPISKRWHCKRKRIYLDTLAGRCLPVCWRFTTDHNIRMYLWRTYWDIEILRLFSFLRNSGRWFWCHSYNCLRVTVRACWTLGCSRWGFHMLEGCGRPQLLKLY